MLRSHATEKTFVLKTSSDPYPDALWLKANHYIVWFHKINFRLHGSAAGSQVNNNVSTKYSLCPMQKCI